MKKVLLFILTIGVASMLLPSCQKGQQSTPQSNQDQSSAHIQAVLQGLASAPTFNSYGPGAVYQIELSANASGPTGGGLWLWVGLYPNWTGDYSGSDCGHGGEGAASDKGDVTWHYAGTNNDSLVINGGILNGLGSFPTTIEVPSKVGHYTGTIGTYLTLPGFIPPFIGNSQLQ